MPLRHERIGVEAELPDEPHGVAPDHRRVIARDGAVAVTPDRAEDRERPLAIGRGRQNGRQPRCQGHAELVGGDAELGCERLGGCVERGTESGERDDEHARSLAEGGPTPPAPSSARSGAERSGSWWDECIVSDASWGSGLHDAA